MILAAKLTLLVPPIRCTPALEPRPTTTPRSAISVPAVAGRADRERRPAPPAHQQIQDDAGQQPLAQTPSETNGQADPTVGCSPRHTRLSHPAPAGPTPAGASSVRRDDTQFLRWCGKRGSAADDDWDQFRGETSEFRGSRPPFTPVLDGPGKELLQGDAVAAHEQLSLRVVRVREGRHAGVGSGVAPGGGARGWRPWVVKRGIPNYSGG